MISNESGVVHAAGDEVQTLILGLCCLEYFWEDHPDVVKALAQQRGKPELVRYAANAKELRLALTKEETP